MRILMLSWEYPPHVVGGLGVHVSSIVPSLARLGHQVVVITPQWSGGEADSTVNGRGRVIRVSPPATVGNFFTDAERTNAVLADAANGVWSGETISFDLIHAHDWLVEFAAAELKKKYKVPLVATIHATERGRGRGRLAGDISRQIDETEWSLAYEAWRVITVSRYMAGQVADYFHLPPDKVDVVPNGVETERFDSLDLIDLKSFRDRWAQPDERLVFFVGRLQVEKGVQVLLEAAPRVLADYPRARIVIAGTGNLSDSLKSRAEELAVADRVTFAGRITDETRDRLLKVSDVAVFPSLYEPFGIVALEAMAARCPVVVSDAGGLEEVVADKETGIVVPSDSVASLATGILDTLGDRDRALLRAQNAYRVVRSQYNWERVAEKTVETYDRVVRERAVSIWA